MIEVMDEVMEVGMMMMGDDDDVMMMSD